MAGSDALSKWWLVTLAAVDQRSSICHVSDGSLLVLDSMDFSFSHLLSSVNRRKFLFVIPVDRRGVTLLYSMETACIQHYTTLMCGTF